MQWWFERENPMGGASSGAFRNLLAGAGVPAVDTFVREVVQNSVDAALAADSVVRIRIRSDRIEGEDLSRWRSLLGLETDSDILARSGLLPAQQLAEQLVGSLEVLVVEDFETAGLGGTVDPIAHTDEDNFRRLCHKVGSTREGEGLGGSFGFGKATYWAASSIWTVVFYSRFEPTGRTGDDWARFVGVSWFKEHTGPGGEGAEDVEFTGRAFFGAPGHYDSQPVSRPIINDHAQRLAEQLGLHVRGENETGTTAVILGNQLDLDGVTEGIERHWWPRILAGRLDVEVLGERPPQPLSRPDLRPFVRAWEILFGERSRKITKTTPSSSTTVARWGTWRSYSTTIPVTNRPARSLWCEGPEWLSSTMSAQGQARRNPPALAYYAPPMKWRNLFGLPNPRRTIVGTTKPLGLIDRFLPTNVCGSRSSLTRLEPGYGNSLGSTGSRHRKRPLVAECSKRPLANYSRRNRVVQDPHHSRTRTPSVFVSSKLP